MLRKYHILTLGCQMNKNDSERIAGLLQSIGYEATENQEEGDLLIINSCSVRQTAEERVVGIIYNWQKLRAKNPDLIIAVTGCMAGRDKDGKLKHKISGADLFFKIDDLPMLPRWLDGLDINCHSDLPAGRQGESEESISDYLQINPARANTNSVFVSIQTGCDNFCTYCVVPYARGRERNRPLGDILGEIKTAVENGAKEITLLGQVVNHYTINDKITGCEPAIAKSINNPFSDDFAALLWEINQIPGDFRIHFTAADPQYFNDEQIEALKLPKQVNYLHLPVQSGDNEILKKMNRKYTREQYIETAKKIRVAVPDIALGTDIIVGFCGETDAQFANTVDLYKQCDFDISYHAMYSERTGTTAAKAYQDDVARAVKKQRWQVLQDYMEKRTLEKNQKYLGQTARVLVDKCIERICSGITDDLKFAQFLGTPDLVGQFVKIKITQPMAWVMRGELRANNSSQPNPIVHRLQPPV
ncbi:MAG: tRNA (N6-isopentenyl adenosine(37)-C2)-methylthiotransferase MiaB [Candidatus Magasanikbacteria bacterium]